MTELRACLQTDQVVAIKKIRLGNAKEVGARLGAMPARLKATEAWGLIRFRATGSQHDRPAGSKAPERATEPPHCVPDRRLRTQKQLGAGEYCIPDGWHRKK